MTVKLVKEQVQKFISSQTPEVLAIKGDWGVGKTYSWEMYIKEFKEQCTVKYYSYVSLFGINSIDDLKKAIFLNRIATKDIGEPLNIGSRSKAWFEKVPDLKFAVAGVGVGVGDIFGSISQLAMDETIICFDDLERHSKGISIKDFMGLVSYFKEQKNCKIVLLLNEDVADETFNDYQKYKEKIVDRQLHFEPTAEECFNTMFPDEFEFRSLVRDRCAKLEIKNKRVIRKVVEHIKEFLELVERFDEKIKRQVIESTIVLSWCYYCHSSDVNRIPKFSFVKQEGIRSECPKVESNKELTVKWNLTLNRYGYQFTDKIDLAVAQGIEQGFIDKETLIPLCETRQEEIKIEASSVKWNEAWKLFHGSFDNNEEDIAQAFEEGMLDIAESTSASQYSTGLKILRVINKNTKADELIDFFIESRKNNPEVLNTKSILSFEIQDPKFAERLEEAYLKLKPEPTVAEIIDKRRGENSYNASESEVLSRLETKDIYKLFMSYKGDDLNQNIQVFRLLSNSNSTLAKNVKEALDQIAEISDLNKSRMAKFS